MIKLRLGRRGSGKTAATYAEVLANRGGRVVFLVSPCEEGGTPAKEIFKRAPRLWVPENGVIDWCAVLPQISARGGIVRVDIDEKLGAFLSNVSTLTDYILILDDLCTCVVGNELAVPLRRLFPKTRRNCDVYLTAHEYYGSFGSFLAQWRNGADEIIVYGAPPVEEIPALVGKYNGEKSDTDIEVVLKTNPNYNGVVIYK